MTGHAGSLTFMLITGIAAVAAVPASADELVLTARRDAGTLLVTARADTKTDGVLSALADGFTSEIVYQFRVYRRRQGLLAILGDSLIGQADVVVTARKDPFEDVLVVERNGAPQTIADAERFAPSFFALEDWPVIDGLTEVEPLLVIARYRLREIRFVPPLHLATVFTGYGSKRNRWVRIEVP